MSDQFWKDLQYMERCGETVVFVQKQGPWTRRSLMALWAYANREAAAHGYDFIPKNSREHDTKEIIAKANMGKVSATKKSHMEISPELPKMAAEKERHQVNKKVDLEPSDVLPDDEQYEGERTVLFVKYLEEKGAGKQWVKASYSDIGAYLNITPPAVKLVIDDTLKEFSRLRVCRVMAGPQRGNNFTFNQDIPEPDYAEQPTPPELVTKGKQAGNSVQRDSNEKDLDVDKVANEILAHLHDRKKSEKSPIFILKIDEAAKSVGVDEQLAINALMVLKNENFIKLAPSKQGNSSQAIVTVLEAA